MSADKVRRYLTDLLFDFLGALFFDIGIYNFALNAEFAPVGVSGLALIINYLTELPMGLMSIALNIPIIIFSYQLLGKGFLLKSAKTMVVFALVLDVVVPGLPSYSGPPLTAAICTGVLSGIGLTMVYMRGASTGGTDFLIMAVRKRLPHVSIGQLTLIIDGTVILLGGFVFKNIDAVILGLVATVATTMIIDKIMYGLGAGKLIFIVTAKGNEVARNIADATGRGATFLYGRGSYTLDEKKVVMCACNNSQVIHVQKAVQAADSQAFLIITDSNEVYGEGFKSIREIS